MRALARPFGSILLAAVLLGACDSAEDRAEAHYRNAVDLIAEGDPDRATVELRNVFRLDEDHAPARLAFARILRDEGDLRGALEQYQRAVEQSGATLEGLRELAELSLAVQDFDTARRSVARGLGMAPQDPGLRALEATLDYQGGDRARATRTARAVLGEAPGTVAAHMVLIADRLAEEDAASALVLADAGLAAVPGDEGLHLVRLAALEKLGDDKGVGTALAAMADLFPRNPGIREALIGWHLRAGDPQAAEAVLRAAAARIPEDPQAALLVVRFLREIEGPAAAAAELDRLIGTAADPVPFRRARAGLDFMEGRTEAAIASLRALVEGAAPSDTIRETQLALAEMLDATGDAAGRDALLGVVLEVDPAHVGALKLRARAAIAADRPEAAVQDMRAALAQAPRDPEVMTILGLAHEREGSRALAGERYALAVEVSNRGAAESGRYARFLLRDGRTGPAEEVVTDALRRAPADRGLLGLLGGIHLEHGDWIRARQVAAVLREAADPEGLGLAAEIETASLRGEIGAATGEAAPTRDLAVLRRRVEASGDPQAMADLMQAYIAVGDLAGAQDYVGAVLAGDPAGLPGRMMQAGLQGIRSETAAALAGYRAIVRDAPALPQAHLALSALLEGTGQAAEAGAALDAGLAATGGSEGLMLAKAALLERTGDPKAAIALYETLYARDSGSTVVANNLASLLTSQRGDAQSLDRAFAIARRLRDSEVPHFQDTYGWILFLRGDVEQAAGYLAQAAEALPDNALVQFHLGELRFARRQWAEARAHFVQVLALGEADPAIAGRPEVPAARARLAEIDAAPATDSDG